MLAREQTNAQMKEIHAVQECSKEATHLTHDAQSNFKSTKTQYETISCKHEEYMVQLEVKFTASEDQMNKYYATSQNSPRASVIQ